MVVNHKPPPSSQACKEARRISQKVGRFLFGAFGSPYKSLWFNTSKDVFWWDRKAIKWHQIRHNKHVIHCVENVAVDLPDHLGYCFDITHDMCCTFPFCKRLQLVLQHNRELGDKVEFLKVRDNDEVSVMSEDEGVVSWRVIEENFEEDYAFMYADKDARIPSGAEPPLLEVVEVVPIRHGED